MGKSVAASLSALGTCEKAVVVGPGPSAAYGIAVARELGLLDKSSAVVVADSAYYIARKLKVKPKVIVTDFDGIRPVDLLEAATSAAVVAHVHGDNAEAALALLSSLAKKASTLVVTSQVGGMPPIVGVHGFTDGDRAFVVAARIAAKAVALVGMDFIQEPPVAKSGRNRALVGKAKRELGLRLLETMACKYAEERELINLSMRNFRCAKRLLPKLRPSA